MTEPENLSNEVRPGCVQKDYIEKEKAELKKQGIECDEKSKGELKCLQYRTNGPRKNLNCKSTNKHGLVECRHLAKAYVQNGKIDVDDWFEKIDSGDKIEKS